MYFQEKEIFINTAEKETGGEFNEVHIQSWIPGREYGSQHCQDFAAAITPNTLLDVE